MKDIDIFLTEVKKYKQDEAGIYGDWIIEAVLKQGILKYSKRKIGFVEELAGSKFFKYEVFWGLDIVEGSFIIDTYYGKKGNRYIYNRMFKEIMKYTNL